jgi:hypothetical protein
MLMADFMNISVLCLIEAADHGGAGFIRGIGVMKALNRHVQQVFASSRKDPHWGRRKLSRDN